MRSTEIKLRRVIRSLLIENFDVTSRKKLEKTAESLNIASKWGLSNNKDMSYMIQVYNSLLASQGFQLIDDTGVYRLAYSSPSDFFVIKVAKSYGGTISNKSEAEIASGHHSTETRSMFLDMYDYDKINDNPHWIICEKVIPLKKIEDINVLSKIFPTFWKITNGLLNDPDEFKEFVIDVIAEWTGKLGLPARSGIDFVKPSKDKYFSGKDISPEDYYYSDRDSNKVKYNLIYPGTNFKVFLEKVEWLWDEWMDRPVSELNLRNVKSGEDIKRLANCFKHISNTDLHSGNLAIKYNKNISPKDIVILDLDLYRSIDT